MNLSIPTVVGPRYSSQGEADSPETDDGLKNPYLAEGSAPGTEFNIALSISTGIPLQEVVCPSHETEIVVGKQIAWPESSWQNRKNPAGIAILF